MSTKARPNLEGPSSVEKTPPNSPSSLVGSSAAVGVLGLDAARGVVVLVVVTASAWETTGFAAIRAERPRTGSVASTCRGAT